MAQQARDTTRINHLMSPRTRHSHDANHSQTLWRCFPTPTDSCCSVPPTDGHAQTLLVCGETTMKCCLYIESAADAHHSRGTWDWQQQNQNGRQRSGHLHQLRLHRGHCHQLHLLDISGTMTPGTWSQVDAPCCSAVRGPGQGQPFEYRTCQ